VRALSPGWKFWLLTVLAVIGMSVTFSLGRWQLSRAAQKEALQAGIETQRQQPELDGRSLTAGADVASLIHRRIVLRGHWLPAHTVFLDNRQMHGKPGFFVLTPFQLQGSPAVLLVQRGWVARNFVDRTLLPDIPTSADPVSVSGRIAPPPSKLFEFEGAQAGRIRQNLDLGSFRAETHLPLLDATVVQTGDASDGLLRDWPEPATGVDKHYGYAFQWFGLSGLIALLYVWFQIVRRFILSRPLV
jgi:surfeit locus 1 family protein